MAEEKEKTIWSDMTTSRSRVSDLVFNHLAGAILRGHLAPGEPLPAERDLAERYDVSRVLVREAVHKLKELGLLRVKQGGQTIVLDPAEASDPRLMALELEVDGATPDLQRELIEKLLTHAISLLEVVHGRLEAAAIEQLTKDAAAIESAPESGKGALVTRFWLDVAKATDNRLLARETRFWLELAERGGVLHCLYALDEGLYLRLVERLRNEKDAATIMLRLVRPALARRPSLKA